MGAILHDIGINIGVTAPDWLLFLMILGTFLWYRSSLRATVKRFEGFLKNLNDIFTQKIDSNATIVKEHLDNYNMNQNKNWETLRDLVIELKDKKVWQAEYLLEIRNITDKYESNRDKIKDLDKRVRSIERENRQMDSEIR